MCGMGLGGQLLPPGAANTFDVYVRPEHRGRELRVSLPYSTLPPDPRLMVPGTNFVARSTPRVIDWDTAGRKSAR